MKALSFSKARIKKTAKTVTEQMETIHDTPEFIKLLNLSVLKYFDIFSWATDIKIYTDENGGMVMDEDDEKVKYIKALEDAVLQSQKDSDEMASEVDMLLSTVLELQKNIGELQHSVDALIKAKTNEE